MSRVDIQNARPVSACAGIPFVRILAMPTLITVCIGYRLQDVDILYVESHHTDKF